MRKILTLAMSGLVTVLPLALTVYVIWWLVNTVEGWLRRALIAVGLVSPANYWPGLGLIAGFLLLLFVGGVVNAYAGKILLKYWNDFLGRIPFVKTLYGGFRDVVSLLPSGSGEKRDLQRVVLARFADVHAIGFVTREDVPTVLLAHGGQDWVTVYFPMSYAFGGYTIYLPRDRVQPLDISVEDAMRLAITAGRSEAGIPGRQIPGMAQRSGAGAGRASRREFRGDRGSVEFYQQLCRARRGAHGAAIDRARQRSGARERGDRLAAPATVRDRPRVQQPRCSDRTALGGCGQRRGLARGAVDGAKGQGHRRSRARACRHGARHALRSLLQSDHGDDV